MKKITQNLKTESILRALIAIIGILTFNISSSFGWGFILGALISKENIDLKTKEGVGLLALITAIMVAAVYFLLDSQAVLGYIASIIVYFIMKFILHYIQDKNTTIGA